MPQLLLLRHAKSSWASSEISDHDRVLTERGVADAARVGAQLAASGLVPDLILTSTARRARQTVDAVLGALPAQTRVEAIEALYNASLARLFETIAHRAANTDIVLVVGHNPSIAQAAIQLCAGQTGTAANALRKKYPAAALAHFDTGKASLTKLGAPMPLVSFRTPND